MKETLILNLLVEYDDKTKIIYEIANLSDLAKCIEDNKGKRIKMEQIERYLAHFLETTGLADSRKAWDD